MPTQNIVPEQEDFFPPPPAVIDQNLLARFIESSLIAGVEPDAEHWKELCEGLDGNSEEPLQEGSFVIFKASSKNKPDDYACLPKASSAARFFSEYIMSVCESGQKTTLEYRDYDPLILSMHPGHRFACGAGQ